MSKKAVFPLVIFFAILLSACTTKAPVGTENQAGENKPVETETEQSQSSSLRELLALGKNQKCTVTTTSADDDGTKTDTVGTIYISGKKMAQEVSVTSTDKEIPKINMRMISDGSYVYTWNTDTKNQGMKMKFEETQAEDKTPDTNNTQAKGVNMDEKYDMKCTGWVVDNSKFAIPADVQFTDLSEMLKNLPTMPANIPSAN